MLECQWRKKKSFTTSGPGDSLVILHSPDLLINLWYPAHGHIPSQSNTKLECFVLCYFFVQRKVQAYCVGGLAWNTSDVRVGQFYKRFYMRNLTQSVSKLTRLALIWYSLSIVKIIPKFRSFECTNWLALLFYGLSFKNFYEKSVKSVNLHFYKCKFMSYRCRFTFYSINVTLIQMQIYEVTDVNLHFYIKKKF
jgi:hypothetical protein